jgi:hypothetical protein
MSSEHKEDEGDMFMRRFKKLIVVCALLQLQTGNVLDVFSQRLFRTICSSFVICCQVLCHAHFPAEFSRVSRLS